MAGCKCVPCRAANSRYECARRAARERGEWNGLVCAGSVRVHLAALSSRGIGKKTISDIAGIGTTVIDRIRSGKQKKIRALNEKRILAIEARSVLTAAQLVPAARAHAQIKWMITEGFTRREIARRLGYRTPQLQFRKPTITARNAMKVEKLYNQLRAGGDEDL